MSGCGGLKILITMACNIYVIRALPAQKFIDRKPCFVELVYRTAPQQAAILRLAIADYRKVKKLSSEPDMSKLKRRTAPAAPVWDGGCACAKRSSMLCRESLRFEILSILCGLGLLAALGGAWAAGPVLRRIGLVAEPVDTVGSGRVGVSRGNDAMKRRSASAPCCQERQASEADRSAPAQRTGGHRSAEAAPA